MANPYFSFPGLDVISGDFILTHGSEPSVCRLVVDQDSGTVDTKIGNLEFADDEGNKFVFTDCAVSHAEVTSVGPMRGSRLVLDIVDRRWKWKNALISGRFNVYRPNSTIETATKYTCYELANHLLTALGELGHTVEFPDNDMIPPYVEWLDMGIGKALEWLCLVSGATISLGHDDKVYISPVDDGPSYQLPIGGEKYPLRDINASIVPATLTVRSAPLVYTDILVLEPVVLDKAGEYQSLETFYKSEPDLRYSWPDMLPSFEPTAAGNEEYMPGVRDTMYYVYRIWGLYNQRWLNGDTDGKPDLGIKIPGWYGFTLDSIQDILPLLSSVEHPHGNYGQFTRHHAVIGLWHDEPTVLQDIIRDHKYPVPNIDWEFYWEEFSYYRKSDLQRKTSGFRVDINEGLVFFDEPMFSIAHKFPADNISQPAATKIYPAPIGLLCSFRPRKKDGSMPRLSVTKDLNPDGDGDAVVIRDDINWRAGEGGMMYPPSKWWTDATLEPASNTIAVADAINQGWAAYEAERNRVPISHMEWSGFKSIHPVGHIQQVRWLVGDGRPAMTMASRNTNMVHASLRRTERRRIIKADIVDNPHIQSGGLMQ